MTQRAGVVGSVSNSLLGSGLAVAGAAGELVNPFTVKKVSDRDVVRQQQMLINLINGDNALKTDGLMGKRTSKAMDALSDHGKALLSYLTNARSKEIAKFDKNATEAPKDVHLRRYNSLKEEDRVRFVNEVARPAAIAASRYGLLEEGVAAQIIMETGWGEAMHRIPNNFTGMKANIFKGYPGEFGVTKVGTTEYFKADPTKITDEFAIFKSIDDWAKAYAWYLLDSGSAYRYKKGNVANWDEDHPSYGKKVPIDIKDARTVQQYAESLHYGGYMTHPIAVDPVDGLAGVGYKKRILA